MKIEIAICTWNRAELLSQTLDSILAAIVNSQYFNELNYQFCVLVVDNRSTDSTANTINEFSIRAQHDFPVRNLFEPNQGHVFARNLAIDHCDGDLLIWTDDDILVETEWIDSYVDAALEQAEMTFWGGPITPRPVAGAKFPSWISKHWSKLSGCFAERDLGSRTFQFSPDVLPYGANFAIRTSVQKLNRFDENFGRSRNLVVGDDDLRLFRALISAGLTGAWLPEAKVLHQIDKSRMTTDFVARYFKGQGFALVHHGVPWHENREALRKEARHELNCYRIKRWFSDSDTWLSHLIRASLAQGQLEALEKRTES